MESDSDSSLSSAPEEEVQKLAPIFVKAKKATKLVAPPPVVSPPRPKRAPSPPHEEVLADNPDIAFIVMFRSRFQEAFPGKTPHFGPQDIERGVVDSIPSPEIQSLLCALLALVLNRKKPVERGHHGRALEEAVASHKNQWPRKWGHQNPLHGGKDFTNMTPAERLNLLHTLVLWSLSSSDVVSGMIKDKYKQQRHNDDENQPLSVQPWGVDGDKRRYFLVQGLDDTSFRVYREGSRYTRNAHWWSVAGSIDEVKALAEKLENEDRSQAARRLASRMLNAVPMFEATEEKRRRREYRQQRRAAFTRPEPGFGIYEGRTRGKRTRYNYEEDEDGEDFMSDATSARRSTRHQSARSTPFESGPTFTASGRQTKRPRVGDYGESLLSNNVMSTDELAPDYDESGVERAGSNESDPVRGGGRATRSGGAGQGPSNPRQRKHIEGYNSIDEISDEDDAGDEWDSDKNGSGDDEMPDADDEESPISDNDEDDQLERGPPRSILVKLKLGKEPRLPTAKVDVKDESATHPLVRVPPPADAVEEARPGTAKTEAKEVVAPNGHVDAPLPSTAAHSEPQVVLPSAPAGSEASAQLESCHF
ncbi:hypothetical protein M409DRAFT_70228 [Zasmidium cellare ATCC 36951]|uniref:WHIM1 domain-containing protein n=1 Tax=Zasmidium cellare ATCC 36951 TaxID=1080233 RepID=A0A6A6C166_ZASCE|nr:uncharacterized protein M409DRAFT_70228 [Zasmidium cellare ATCC 36951]KAF2160685.1 hypothetical protein M409DRAFT_70228 [Zasmidium cellare ATCC 36951]